MSSLLSSRLSRLLTITTILGLAACDHHNGGLPPVGGNGADIGVGGDGGAGDDGGGAHGGGGAHDGGGDGGAPDGSADACAGVVCRRPPAAQCIDNHTQRTYASFGECDQGMCSYQSTDKTCALGCSNGVCMEGDPALDDPARPSFPFECQGDPQTAAQITEHVPQADEVFRIDNEKNWNATEFVLRVKRVLRTCTTLTGCSAWQYDGTPLGLPEDYALYTWVAGDGTVGLLQDDVDAGSRVARVQATIISGDFQVALDKAQNGGQPRLYKARYTRVAGSDSPETGCFSLASKYVVHASQADGSHVEEFMLGTTRFLAPVPRVDPPPRAPWDRRCQGTPAGDALIATWFKPGATTLDATSAFVGHTLTQRCHPITGCTPWMETASTSRRLNGLKTAPPGFALRIDGTTLLPIVDGVVTTDKITGSVTADRCVWFEGVGTYNDPPSAIVTTSYYQEQNKL